MLKPKQIKQKIDNIRYQPTQFCIQNHRGYKPIGSPSTYNFAAAIMHFVSLVIFFF